MAKVLKLQLQQQSSNEYSGLISFRIDCFDDFVIQEILKSLLQHHSLKASILWHSIFFIFQVSHLYMTTGKSLTIWTFVDKVMFLLFTMLPRFVLSFLLRHKGLLISWLQSLSAVILEPKKRKVYHCFHFAPFYLQWNDGKRCHGLSFLNAEFQASFSPSSFNLIKRHLSSSSLSAIRVISFVYLTILISPGNLDSSSPAFLMMLHTS